MSIKIIIGDTDISSHTALPIKWNDLLDERLDECRLSVRGTSDALFRIGTEVSILQTCENGTIQKDFIVWADDSQELPPGSGMYNHELSLIEPTKILEGITCGTLTFVNSLGRTYTANAIKVEPAIESESSGWSGKGTYMSPVNTDKNITITPFFETFQNPTGKWKCRSNPYTVTITKPNGLTETIVNGDFNGTYTFVPTLDGLYKLQYVTEVYLPGIGTFKSFTATFEFIAIVNYDPLTKYTIASVIKRILNLCEPHLQSEAPRFKLDDKQAEKFEKIIAPEFSFTNMTLKEILDQIGGYIHGIPRLVRGESGKLDTIKYDMLGGIEKATLADDSKYPYIGEVYSINGEQYATKLDSPVENLVNTLSNGEAALTEPYFGGYKSVRSEEAYARITDGNMIIETTERIYSVHKLEIVNPNNSKKRADITAFLFEGADYGRLSSYNGSFPTSKAHAIYYELGERNIKGLFYKSPKVISGSKAGYAITNIIKDSLGENFDSEWWEKNYPTLSFCITYTPIFSARVIQHKAYIGDNAFERSLYYNQGANLVETRYYGENLKGTIARMGNAEKIRTYRLQDLSLIPTAGQMWDDDYYVSSVAVSIHADCFYLEVGLSKDFNRLSQYIGINSEWRAYEVSEKKAYARDIAYSDYVVISDDNFVGDGKCLLNKMYGNTTIAESFYYNSGDDATMTAAVVNGYDGSNVNPITTVTLPVISTAFGNTLTFTFRMADNYSAGTKSDYDSSGSVSGYWQTDVPYSDYYGRLDTVTFKLAPNGRPNYPLRVPQGDCVLGISYNYVAVNDNDRLVVDKNGNEALGFNYNLQFVTTFSDMIIGTGITRRNSMVGGAVSKRNGSALYVMKNRIGKFDTAIDFGQATKIVEWTTLPPTAPTSPQMEIVNESNTGRINFGKDPTATVSGEAWAIADIETGEIILARNILVESGKTFKLPTITFTHKLPTRS